MLCHVSQKSQSTGLKRTTQVKHTGQETFDGKCDRDYDHKQFVGARVDDAADYGLQIPFSSDPTVHQIRHSSVGKKRKRPVQVALKDEVANDWSSDKPRDGKDVRNGVDVLARGKRGHRCFDLGRQILRLLLGRLDAC